MLGLQTLFELFIIRTDSHKIIALFKADSHEIIYPV